AFGFPMSGDPVTAYDSLGNLYYENMYNSGGNIVGCKVIKSTDNGATWTAAVTAISGNDKNWIAADQTAGPYANYVYSTMTNGSSGNFSRSTDFGTTWQNTFVATPHNLPGMMVAVGPNTLSGNVSGGAVYVVTNSGNSFSPVYTFFVSTNGGQTFQQKSSQIFANYVGENIGGRHSVQNMRTRPYPFITADNSYGPYRGRLYLVYASNTPVGNGNKPDIFCRYSTDQGATWSSAVVINDDPNTTTHHQWMPAIWCDKETGRLYAKWFDTRNVPTSDSAEVYASYSDNGGITWVENQNLSTSKFKIDCSTCGGGGTPRYQGDYDAIISNSITSLSVWSDFRFGSFGSFVAYFPDYAMTISQVGDTIKPNESTDVIVSVPAVKLYDKSVKFTVESVPPANFIYQFPQGDSLTSYPDSISITINANNVPDNNYTMRVFGRGPNGTPVHERSFQLLVTNPVTYVLQPNGGEVLYVGTSYPIQWEKIFVDLVKIEYSTDGGTSWNLIADGVDGNYISGEEKDSPLLFNQYDWVVPNAVSSNCLVRISDSSDPLVFDISENAFSIEIGPQPGWLIQTAPVTSTILCVDVIDTLAAWAGTVDGKSLRTTNGGQTWVATNGLPGGEVTSISSVENNRAFAISNSSTSTRIRRTVSSGVSWSTVYENTDPEARLNAITMLDPSNGYAIGNPISGQWLILKTTDAGTTWNNISTLPQNGTEKGLSNSMKWVDLQNGWFGTDASRIYRTTNGGLTWTSSSANFQNINAVTFSDISSGVSAGEDINYTSDGGANWFTKPGQITGEIVSAASAKQIPGKFLFVTGNEVYKTDDSGDAYTLSYSQADTLKFIDVDAIKIGENYWITGYAVGDSGTIAKYKELYLVTETESVQNIIPETFSLKQNYPNPFNPNTTIEFSLPVASDVELAVFNVLGQQVATLIQGQRSAGNHSVTWNAFDSQGVKVSSGIYFYVLKAKGVDSEENLQIKKMVLLK
ncbi:MAG: T9SS type A sorting domain-containing protein, partial [Ignavibacteriaceae bacterium]|nr:T9SS type A sorting domain-containing protein [Ignavibacteriaceae bacterium]